ncbi:hypothetical protein LTR37_021350 [Vermiconidia calcicola]|uniref:Uncharacterized protein n=1 Tax=Vermiconidia calcicola TaxID=1690605 RepID=A0ACC3M8X6_9PEZI|nr:hypothetical protein LTR37_021350 [Vermiconidia calcicola]
MGVTASQVLFSVLILFSYSDDLPSLFTVRVSALGAVMLPIAGQAVNIVQSNDDGWAEKNLRRFYNSLTDAGFSTFISAPAEDQSGRSSLDSPQDSVDDGCQFGSCPRGSPPTGRNSSEPRFNYVNSYPVTAMKYGINTLAKEFYGGKPDIAVAGPNVGSNLGIITQFSGTIGAATAASKLGVPGIAFSGSSGEQTAWNAPLGDYMTIYADLSTTVTQALVSSGKPYLPSNTWLNVNYPKVENSSCSSAADFKFVLSRIYPAVPFITDGDVQTCGNGGRLPTERDVIGTKGCHASISVGVADSKGDAGVAKQTIVRDKLKSILSCLPD